MAEDTFLWLFLGPEDETAPLYAAARENPAFPTRSGAGDYLDLVSIQGLVDETLAFLGVPEATVVTVKWDRAFTKRVQALLSTVDVQLLDHVIIGRPGFAAGWMR